MTDEHKDVNWNRRPYACLILLPPFPENPYFLSAYFFAIRFRIDIVDFIRYVCPYGGVWIEESMDDGEEKSVEFEARGLD